MPDNNGLTHSPFSDAVCPVPSATEGDQGTGGGLTSDPGPNGLTAVPWKNPPAGGPPPIDASGGPFGNPSRMSSIGGKTFEGETLAGDITLPPHTTIDKR